MEEELSKQRGQAGLAVMLVMGGETWMQPWRGPAVPEEEVGSQECQWAKDTWDPQLLAHPPRSPPPCFLPNVVGSPPGPHAGSMTASAGVTWWDWGWGGYQSKTRQPPGMFYGIPKA